MPRAAPPRYQPPQLCKRSKHFSPYNLRSHSIAHDPTEFFVIHITQEDHRRIKQVLPRCWSFKSTNPNKIYVATSYCPDNYTYNQVRQINPDYYFHIARLFAGEPDPAFISNHWIHPFDTFVADYFNKGYPHPWYPDFRDYLRRFNNPL